MIEAKKIYNACGEGKPFPCVDGGVFTFSQRDSKPIGFVYVKPLGEDEAEVIYIGVLPEYRRQGVACELIQGLQKQYQKLYLEVETTNQAACVLYQSLGFALQRTRPNYYGSGRDALDMLWWAHHGS